MTFGRNDKRARCLTSNEVNDRLTLYQIKSAILIHSIIDLQLFKYINLIILKLCFLGPKLIQILFDFII